MNKDSSSGSLVLLKDAAEDRIPALISVGNRELTAYVRAGVKEIVKNDDVALDASLSTPLAGAQIFAYLVSAGVAAVALAGAPQLLGALIFSIPFSWAQGLCYGLAINSRSRTIGNRSGFIKSGLEWKLAIKQHNACKDKKARLVALADAHLEQGGLLDEKTLSYLAAIPEEHLQKASDRLAITVLQARRMLAYERGGRCDENLRPATFARFRLIPGRAEHGILLREKLCGTKTQLAEDKGPAMPLPDMALPERIPEVENLKISKLGFALRTIAAPLFLFADRRRLQALENITLPDAMHAKVEVPALCPAAGFSEALARYERDVERLDLPALRGADGGRLLLGGPRAAVRPGSVTP